MNYLVKEKKEYNNNKIKIKVPSDLTSYNSKKNEEKFRDNKIYKNMTSFLNLFQYFNKHFAYINLIIVIDSFLQKNFFQKA